VKKGDLVMWRYEKHTLTPFFMKKSTTTVLSQLKQLMPMQEFLGFVGQHKADKYVKHFTTENQLSVLLYAQATGKDSLREIETGLRVQGHCWYHLGITNVARNTLANANAKRPYAIFESMFYSLLEKCQKLTFGTAFSFRNDLYAVDASTVNLCLNLFPWAKFRAEKGAFKLHTIFNVKSQIPEVVVLTDGKVGDITGIKKIDFSKFPKGSIFVFDRAYIDYAFLYSLVKAGHHFVVRKKVDANIFPLRQSRKPVGEGVISDEKIAFTGEEAQKDYPDDLRLVTYYCKETNKTYEFLTDEFRLSALNIAAIYKSRWQIELFFKWIKQHLKVKTFLGTSKNAVMIQIWVAMIYYLLLAFIKHQTKFKGSLLKLSGIVSEAILFKVHFIDLLSLTPKSLPKALARGHPQLKLF
jgi:hypothetical protein